MPPTANDAITRPAIEARELADLEQQHGDIGEQTHQEDAFAEHGEVADARGRDTEDVAVAQDHSARVERLARCFRQAAQADDSQHERDQRDHAKHQEDAAPMDEIGDHAGRCRSHEIACDGAGEQAPDRDLALRQRDEVGQQRHADRKQATAAGAGDDAQHEQLRKRGRDGAQKRRHGQHDQAANHHLLLADRICHRAEHRQDRAVRHERRGQHRRGGGLHPEFAGDLRDHRVDCAHREGGRKGEKADDRERAVHCALWTLPRQAAQLISAQSTYPTMACGKKRDEFLVIGLASSRTLSPQGCPAANHEPSIVWLPSNSGNGAMAWRMKPSVP